MALFLSTSSGICGTDDDVCSLAKKNSAALLVMSDIHHLTPPAAMLIQQYAPQCDAAIFCGDCAETLSELSFTQPDVVAALPPVTVIVRGNCDTTAVSIPGGFIPLPQSLVLSAAGRRIFITHGHEYGAGYTYTQMQTAAAKNNCTTVLFGHTHIPIQEKVHGIQYVNPGSTSLPRGGSCAGAALATFSSRKTYAQVRFISV